MTHGADRNDPLSSSSLCSIHVKNVFFTFFYSCHAFTFLTFFFIFRTFLKIKNAENLLSMQANSDILVFVRNVS